MNKTDELVKRLGEFSDELPCATNQLHAEAATHIESQSKLIEEMAGALEDVLDTRNEEAKSSMTMQVASENFSNPMPEIKAYESAMTKASNAEKSARALLDNYRSKKMSTTTNGFAKIEHDGDWFVCRMSDLGDYLVNFLGEENLTYKVSRAQMTEEEFKALPDFNGF